MTQAFANDAAMGIFACLDPKSLALLLDLDGTLIDIGPSPFEVDVSDELRASLKRLFELTGGALALVSGRSIADLDQLFSPLKLPSIGGHGAEMRLQGSEITRWAVTLSPELRKRLAQASSLHPGIVVEDKGYSLALHYRRAPDYEDSLLRHIAACCAAFSEEVTEVMPGKALFEVKRPGVNKGEGVRTLMTKPPFAGRMPVFIGDDVTDESVFEVLPDLGGKGFSVSRQFEGVSGIFESPAHVRRALHRLAAGGQGLAAGGQAHPA
jgi:trehalose 6-phosphate phosphatase